MRSCFVYKSENAEKRLYFKFVDNADNINGQIFRQEKYSTLIVLFILQNKLKGVFAMDKFDDVLQKAKDMAETAYKKTGDAIDIGKQRVEIASLNGKISNLYEQLGRKAIEDLKETENEDVCLIINNIKSLEDKVEELKTNILNTKGKVVCPNCKKELDINTKFCSYCGAKVNE